MSQAKLLRASSQEFRDVWNYIRQKPTFLLRDVETATGIASRGALEKIIAKMKKLNMVEVAKGGIKPVVYRAILDQAPVSECSVEETRKQHAEKVWLFIRNLQNFVLKDVEDATGLSAVKHLHLVMGRMEATRLVRVNRKTKPYQYTMIVSNPPLECPDLRDSGRKRKRTGHDRMWSALRILKNFTANDLALYAEVTKASAKTYTRKLAQAGYLTSIERDNGISYVFNRGRDTGLASPAIYSNGQVYDRNERKIVHPKGGQ